MVPLGSLEWCQLGAASGRRLRARPSVRGLWRLRHNTAPADVRDVYRDSVKAALKRCTPLHFSDGMGGAVAGRPIAIRFVDNRTVDNAKSLQ
jgi:hypothetical protein